jgi:hypothetical protein
MAKRIVVVALVFAFGIFLLLFVRIIIHHDGSFLAVDPLAWVVSSEGNHGRRSKGKLSNATNDDRNTDVIDDVDRNAISIHVSNDDRRSAFSDVGVSLVVVGNVSVRRTVLAVIALPEAIKSHPTPNLQQLLLASVRHGG